MRLENVYVTVDDVFLVSTEKSIIRCCRLISKILGGIFNFFGKLEIVTNAHQSPPRENVVRWI